MWTILLFCNTWPFPCFQHVPSRFKSCSNVNSTPHVFFYLSMQIVFFCCFFFVNYSKKSISDSTLFYKLIYKSLFKRILLFSFCLSWNVSLWFLLLVPFVSEWGILFLFIFLSNGWRSFWYHFTFFRWYIVRGKGSMAVMKALFCVCVLFIWVA